MTEQKLLTSLLKRAVLPSLAFIALLLISYGLSIPGALTAFVLIALITAIDTFRYKPSYAAIWVVVDAIVLTAVGALGLFSQLFLPIAFVLYLAVGGGSLYAASWAKNHLGGNNKKQLRP